MAKNQKFTNLIRKKVETSRNLELYRYFGRY